MTHVYSDAFYIYNQDITSPFSSTYEFIPAPEPIKQAEQIVDEYGEPDKLMEEKQQIIEDRGEVLRGKINMKKKKGVKRLPGEKLLKKIHKQNQLENVMMRVVKNLSF